MSLVKDFVKTLSSNSNAIDIRILNSKIDGWLDFLNVEPEGFFSLFGGRTGFKDFDKEEICLFVHLYKPIRCLGRIQKPSDNVKVRGIPESLQYCIVPLTFNDQRKPVFEERKPINLITKKRGLWLICNEYTDLNTYSTKDLFDFYEKYVANIQYIPNNWKFTKDSFQPQFDLDYPLKKTWVQGSKRIRRRKSKKRSIEQLEDVPPPPQLTRSTQCVDLFEDSLSSLNEFNDIITEKQMDIFDKDEENPNFDKGFWSASSLSD